MQEMTMVERVARAICDSDILWYSGKFPDIPVETIRYKAESELSDNYKQLARAAIEAMREVTDTMFDAGNHSRVASKRTDHNTMATWQSMIDAALSE